MSEVSNRVTDLDARTGSDTVDSRTGSGPAGSGRTGSARVGSGRAGSGLRSLSVAMAKGFFRDRVAMFFTILFPLMFLVIFGLLFKDQGAAKVDIIQVGPVTVLDAIPASARSELDTVLTVERSDDLAAALERVRDGDADAVVAQEGNEIALHYSAADQVRSGTVQGLFNSLVQSSNLTAAGVAPTFTLLPEQVEDDSLKVIQYMTPGLIGWAVAMGAMFLAAMTLVVWRQKKVLRRLRLAPVRTSSIVAAPIGVSSLVALVQTALFVAVGMLPIFGLKLTTYWWMAIPMVLAGTLAFLSLGLLIGSFAKTPDAASALSNLIILPMAFLSGSFFPLEGAPDWLQNISRFLPLRHMVDGLLDVMVRGLGPSAVLPEIGILLGFAVVVSGIAVAVFRWEDA